MLTGGIVSVDDPALAYHPSARDRQTNKQTIEISMTIRLATYDDIPAIMPVIDAAREMMHGKAGVAIGVLGLLLFLYDRGAELRAIIKNL